MARRLVVFCFIVVLGWVSTAQADPTFWDGFEKHNTVMLLIDPASGEIVDANAAASAFYGYSRQQLRAMTIQQINQLTPEQVAEERQLAKTEGRNFFIFRHQLANGEVRTVEVHSVPMEFNGRTLLYSIVRDISKQRDLEDDLWHYQTRLEGMVDEQTAKLQAIYDRDLYALTTAVAGLAGLLVWGLVAWSRQRKSQLALRQIERQQRDLLNNTSSVVYIKDIEGHYLFVNKTFEDLFDVTNAQMLGKSDHDFFGGEMADAFRANDLKALSVDTPIEIEELVPMYGGTRTYLSSKFALRDGDGKGYAVCGMSRDITDRKQTEELLRQTKEEAEKANQAKSEFLAAMSHELRTPLNAVLGFAQLLQYDPSQPLSEVQSAHVENILNGGNHLLELVNEILDLVKIESDQMDLVIEEIAPHEVMGECLNLTRALAAKRSIHVIDATDKGDGAPLQTDRLRLKQVLLNLLSNAIKFNNDGGTVTLKTWETQDGFLHISVIDDGQGIAKDDHANVFKMFHRLGADPTIAREGTGIGLTVTKLLIEQMGGRIGFDSKLGEGSTFWIEVPRADNENVMIWTQAMSTDIDAIDKDHNVLVTLLNKVIDPNADTETITSVTEELLDYTRYHFRREEAIMEVCNYPDLKHHKQIHRSLASKVNDLAQDWRANHDPALLRRLHKFLRVWLFDHIINQDTQITVYAVGKKRDIEHALEVLSSVEGSRERNLL